MYVRLELEYNDFSEGPSTYNCVALEQLLGDEKESHCMYAKIRTKKGVTHYNIH